MKNRFISYFKIVILVILFTSIKAFSQKNQINEGEWVSMFNGENLDGWTTKIQHYEVGDNYGDTFRAEENMIKVRYDKYEGDFNDRYGHLYFDQPYSYFHLSLEYRIVGELHPGSASYTIKNSGLMFHSQDPRTMLKEQDWPISVEMQFLAGVEEGKERPTGNMCSPGTDIVYEGKIDERHCVPSNSKTYFGDQWVKAELIVYGDSLVKHIINGHEVLSYTQPQIGGGVANRYDPAIKIDGKLLSEGFIALQSESQPIDFKNIKIKNLKGCKDPKAKNFKAYYVKSDKKSCTY